MKTLYVQKLSTDCFSQFGQGSVIEKHISYLKKIFIKFLKLPNIESSGGSMLWNHETIFEINIHAVNSGFLLFFYTK